MVRIWDGFTHVFIEIASDVTACPHRILPKKNEDA